MKHLLFILLLSGSVWGQDIRTVHGDSVLTRTETFAIQKLIRAEIERWWEEHGLLFERDTTISHKPEEYIYDSTGERGWIPKPEPLKIVLDTVKVDTVGWNSIKSSRWDKANGGGVYSNGWKFYPVLKYTVDTLYDLTPEQIRRLKK